MEVYNSMPIYMRPKEEYKLPEPGDLKFKDIVKFKEILMKAKRSYMYKDEEEFNNSVQLYNIVDLSYDIATYDIQRTSLDDKSFIANLEQLLITSNDLLRRSPYGRSNRGYFRFDIMGNWTKGHIVILIQKKK